MQRSEKTIISASTLITTLLFYAYAKAAGKESAPLVMVGAFAGTLIGEAIADSFSSTTQYNNTFIYAKGSDSR
ncbi:MAG TPA: hypothetical protein VM802_10155 [Chitinophaga sp.]|uniref:hypothetical protein n=1 Tax=Chitinophaga sp. TaxID=1869181 RepID=UPI002C5D10CB|nr:hypothetical protein [Chitinophaga sp.]HVI45225.1 hypothetical protein [Chitinophaga sp.]